MSPRKLISKTVFIAMLFCFCPQLGWSRSLAFSSCEPKVGPQLSIDQLANYFVGAKASCLSPEQIEKDELQQRWVAAGLELSPSETQSFTLYGADLTGSQELKTIAEALLGPTPPLDWSDAAKNCADVMCALSNIYGTEAASKRAVLIYKETGYAVNLSQEVNHSIAISTLAESEQKWSPDEVKLLDQAFKLLKDAQITSSELLKRSDLKKLIRINSMAQLPKLTKNIAAVASKETRSIQFLDGSLKSGLGNLTQSLLHELMHHYDFANGSNKYLNAHDSADFSGLSGWQVLKPGESVAEEDPEWVRVYNKEVTEPTYYKRKKSATFVRDYAGYTPDEDFADSATHYVLNPSALKRIDPKKYEYYKNNVFNQREFTDISYDVWPRLTKISTDYNTVLAAVEMCLDQLQNSPEILQGHFSSENDLYKILVEQNDCFKPLVDKTSEQLHDDPLYCKNGGYKTIAKEILMQAAPTVNSYLSYVAKMIRIKLQSSRSACIEQLKFNYSCYFLRAYPNADILVSGAVKNVSSANTEAVNKSLNEVSLKTPYPVEPFPVQDSADFLSFKDPLGLILACLKTAPFEYNKGFKFSEAATRECLDTISEQQKRLKMSVDDPLGTSIETWKALKGFRGALQNDLFPKWKAAQTTCSREKLSRTLCAANKKSIVDEWQKKYGLTPQAPIQDLVDFLNSKIH